MHKIIRTATLAPSMFLMEVEAPKIAEKRKAGQFVILRIDEKGERVIVPGPVACACCGGARLSKLGEDITVPRSAIPEIIRRLRQISARHGLPIVIFGHAGDGNLHPNILFDRREPEQCAKAEAMAKQIFQASLSLGVTLSGEHGIGVLKRPYLESALGPLSLDVQRRIKQVLDPLDILNPGKMFPERAPLAES